MLSENSEYFLLRLKIQSRIRGVKKRSKHCWITNIDLTKSSLFPTYRIIFQTFSVIFSSNMALSFWQSAFHKQTKVFGFVNKSLVLGHDILGWCSYDARLQGLYTWLTEYEIICHYWLTEERCTTLITKYQLLHQTFNNRNNNRNTRKMCQICSKSTIKTSKHQTLFWCLYCWHWSNSKSFSSVSNVELEQINSSWIKNSMSHWACIPGVYTVRRNNWNTALVRTKFSNLAVLLHIVL